MLGVEYFKALRAPLKHIPMAAVAGIDASNIKAIQTAGACAFGISSSLFVKEAVASFDSERIRNAALRFYSALDS